MKRILITGAAGHVGRTFLKQSRLSKFDVTACDILPIEDLPENVVFQHLDVRDQEGINKVFDKLRPDCVVHLASIVTPAKGAPESLAYDVDVKGSEYIIAACLKFKTKRLVVTSSGAAYGYHPENASPRTEDSPLRGNDEFPYARHKRLVEEMLADIRHNNGELEQVILRVGTILGEGLENQITALFHKPRLLGVWGNESPFVFIWAEDLAQILLRACDVGKPGIYNVAGDGALGISDIASILKKPVLPMPVWLLKSALAIASPLGLSRYGPEQVRFLQYRPVLDNSRLKGEFGYTPKMTSLEAFQTWRKQAGL